MIGLVRQKKGGAYSEEDLYYSEACLIIRAPRRSDYGIVVFDIQKMLT